MEFEDILKHPLLISVVSVSLGTGIIGLMNYKRARRDTIRDKSLEFVDQVSSAMNPPISILYYHIRENLSDLSQQLLDGSALLFQMRLSVRVKSNAYLNEPKFWKAYDQIVHEIRYIMEYLSSINNGENAEEMQEDILKIARQLAQQWDLPFVENREGLDAPFHALITWLDIVWERTDSILSAGMMIAIKSRGHARWKKRLQCHPDEP